MSRWPTPKRFTGNHNGQATYVKRGKKDQAKWESAREVLPGFPIEEPFHTLDDINDYLSDPQIQCLICGKRYKNLGVHVHHIHGLTRDEYCIKYGIPKDRALACKAYRDLRSDISVRVLESNPSLMETLIQKGSEALKEASKHAKDRVLTEAERTRRSEWAKTLPHKGPRRKQEKVDTPCVVCGEMLYGYGKNKISVAKCDRCKVHRRKMRPTG